MTGRTRLDEAANHDRVTGALIRLKCLDCAGEQTEEVKWCQVTTCPLWRFRFGFTPDKAEGMHPGFLDPDHVTGNT